MLGWAEAPRYDPVGRRLYWAKHLRFNDVSESINYDVRVLGRRGVLSMSAVASPDQLTLVKVAMEQVLTFAEFNDGHRYVDFDPDLDEVAAYGIGALVAGKLATKAGLFKGLLAIGSPGKKAIPLALVRPRRRAQEPLFSGRGGRDNEGRRPRLREPLEATHGLERALGLAHLAAVGVRPKVRPTRHGRPARVARSPPGRSPLCWRGGEAGPR
ncbi:MAG: DUF2167 domain-containing protein [Anaerolineales bacterium]|nr:DUF2167 domain-containing protein [Anaerolineales bacterium]